MTHDDIFTEASKYESILDIGCGDCYALSRITSPVRVGIDAYLPLIENTPNKHIERYCYDLRNGLVAFLKDRIFECVICMDVIEHFYPSEAYALIKEIEQVAKKCILFFVPVGKHPQIYDDRGNGNDFFQTHRSTWYPDNFKNIGYETWVDENHHAKAGCDKGAMVCRKIL